MAALTLELDDHVEVDACEGCGGENLTVRGFVYKDGDAFAVYFAQLYPGHADRALALDIALGDWDEESPSGRRKRIGLVVVPDGPNYRMSVQDPERWPWEDSDTFGRLMPRTEALADVQIDRFYEVADFVVYHDTRVREYLEASS